MNPFRSSANRVSARIDDYLARRLAKRLNLWIGCGYPRSGTTWVCRILSAYLEVPWAKLRTLPAFRNAVLHSHFRYDAGLDNCFYVYRDGRDIMVSQYFNRVRLMNTEHHRARDKWTRIFGRLYGSKFDSADIRANLPRYLEFNFSEAHGADLTWPAHIADWVQPGRSNLAILRYEDLLTDAFQPMHEGLSRFSDDSVNEDRLRQAIDQVSFAKWTGRQPGENAPNNFFRKGVANDWRNHFSRESAEIFAFHAGSTLVDLGYEKDGGWVAECGG